MNHREAHNIVAKAISSGAIAPPTRCAHCGVTASDEVVVIYHHHDYAEPLAVTALCRGCHSKVHAGNIPEPATGAKHSACVVKGNVYRMLRGDKTRQEMEQAIRSAGFKFSDSAIQRWETNRGHPPVNMWPTLATFFGVDLSEVMNAVITQKRLLDAVRGRT